MKPESDSRAEHIIVGGGVIGLAVAYELLLRDRNVLVLEGNRPASGATGAAGGMLAPISEADLEEPELIEFGRDSLGRYRSFVSGLERRGEISCAYRTEGTVWAAFHRDDVGELEHLERTVIDRGLECQSLSAEEVRDLEPHLSPRVMGGLLVSGDHQVDPRRLSRCLELAVRALGGKIVSGMRVEAVETSSGRLSRVRGRGRDGRSFEIAADVVVMATGAWTVEGIELPCETPPLRPIKGQLVRLRGPQLLEHVVRTPDVYLIPRADGELLVGGTMEEMGFDLSPTGGALMDLLRHGWEALPGIYELELAEISVGLRSAVADNLPIIGASEIDGLFFACGHYRNGILLAPATAHYLAEAIVGAAVPSELEPFRLERLLTPDGS